MKPDKPANSRAGSRHLRLVLFRDGGLRRRAFPIVIGDQRRPCLLCFVVMTKQARREAPVPVTITKLTHATWVICGRLKDPRAAEAKPRAQHYNSAPVVNALPPPLHRSLRICAGGTFKEGNSEKRVALETVRPRLVLCFPDPPGGTARAAN